jgi:hypothetical protein
MLSLNIYKRVNEFNGEVLKEEKYFFFNGKEIEAHEYLLKCILGYEPTVYEEVDYIEEFD